jgi:hypothetical protein
MSEFAWRSNRVGFLAVLFAAAASQADAGNFSPNLSISGSAQGSTQSFNPSGGGRPPGYGYGYVRTLPESHTAKSS